MKTAWLVVLVAFSLHCGAPERGAPRGSDNGGGRPWPAPSTAPARGTRPAPYVISKGQRFADAQAVARAAGYALHDAHGLEWASMGPDGEVGIDGFYVSLPGDIQLIVFRHHSDDTVGGLHLVAGASQPKAVRTNPPVGDSIELPPADPE